MAGRPDIDGSNKGINLLLRFPKNGESDVDAVWQIKMSIENSMCLKKINFL
jgi:hypothetical protein